MTLTKAFSKCLSKYLFLFREYRYYRIALRSHLSPAEMQRITHHPKPLLVNLSYLMLPRKLEGSPALLERFNRRLQSYRDSGRYDRYFRDLQAGKYEIPQAAPEAKLPLFE